jgi:hypothetical protein
VVPLSKDILVHAIIGTPVPMGGWLHYTYWNGNQHNESWAWIREELEKEPEDFLMELYLRLNK